MNNNTIDDKKTTFLLEEYKQVYEQFRNWDNIAQSKEAIFAVAAFGVLALVLNKDLSIWTLIGAGIVSVSLYLFHVISGERLDFFRKVAKERLMEIEEEINPNRTKDNVRFQRKFKGYEQKAQKNNKKWLGIRLMRWILVGILVILWTIIITCKICNTNCFVSKGWIHQKHTICHRY